MQRNRSILRRCACLGLFLGLLLGSSPTWAQEENAPSAEKSPDSTEQKPAPDETSPSEDHSQPASEPPAAPTVQYPVAATVNGEPIYLSEVEIHFANLAKQRRMDLKGQGKVKAEILKQLVFQRLAATALKRDGVYADDAAVQKGIEKIIARAKQQKLTLDQYLDKMRMGMEALRHEAFWKLAWEQYLERHLSDALESYFKEHHKELDGTQIRVSHILLRPNRYNETEKQLAERANKIRQEIESEEITFEQAVDKYSVGPSRGQQGDLGFFARQGDMLEEFSKAAFALEQGEISKPVSTPFGTHLIRVTDVKPGAKQWTEVIDQIKAPASVDLFEKLAKQERPGAQVAYSGKWPYFDPDTEELVLPPNATAKATAP